MIEIFGKTVKMHYLYSREKETTPNLKANNIILKAYETKTKTNFINSKGV